MIKNIKIGLNLTYLCLSSAPFAFSKMEPCWQKIAYTSNSTSTDPFLLKSLKSIDLAFGGFMKMVLEDDNSYDTWPIYSLEDKDCEEIDEKWEEIADFLNDQCIYMFLYNKNTGDVIGNYNVKDLNNLKLCFDFFQLKNNLFSSDLSFFSVNEEQKLIIKEPQEFDRKILKRYRLREFIDNPLATSMKLIHKFTLNKIGFTMTSQVEDKDKHSYQTKGFMHLLNKYELIHDENLYSKENLRKVFSDDIRLSESFSPKPDILIKNENNEVFINKYRFQEALTKYFDRDDKRRIIAECIGDGQQNCRPGKTYYKLRKAFYDLTEEGRSSDEIELLNKSNILSVYAVMKGKFGNNSIVWGLAEDKETKDRFHWLTDLKADISVLVNQYK